MSASKTDREAELIERQISWLNVYIVELTALEQPGMPKEEHQAVMQLRNAAPQFFWLVCSLLKDALILGIDNLLDSAKNGKYLTLEYLVTGIADATCKGECERRLDVIRKSAGWRDVAIARNHLIAHPVRETLLT